jgi:energy-coupling factor transport system permease protein
MRSALAYVPRPGRPLSEAGAGAACLYLGSLALVCFLYSSPIVLAGAAVAVAIAGLAAGAGRALALAARWAALLAVLIVAVNGFASQRGETILIRGGELPVLGRIDISAEALAEGGVLALRIGVVIAAFAVFTACVDPDRILRLMRPFARHSAMTATLTTRLVPVAAADYARLREATALRGPAAAPAGRAALARRLIAGSLDRAVDLAAALELRGYARGAPRRAARAPASRHSWRFAAAGVAVIAVAVAGLIAGIGEFDAYPTLAVDAGAVTLALAVSLPVLAGLPYAGIGLGRMREGSGSRG